MLEAERRKAEEEAARLEAERQAALLAKEELARQAEDQQKSQEQLVSSLDTSPSTPELLFEQSILRKKCNPAQGRRVQQCLAAEHAAL